MVITIGCFIFFSIYNLVGGLNLNINHYFKYIGIQKHLADGSGAQPRLYKVNNSV